MVAIHPPVKNGWSSCDKFYKKLVKLVDLIKEVEKEFENEHNQVPCNILREKAKKEGISDEEFDKYIKILKENGIIFNPRKNFIKLV